MTDYVIIVREGEAIKVCYKLGATDAQLSLLKEMIKASKLAMTVEIIPEESGERENLLKRLSELVRKEIKFDPESKIRTVQDVMQRMHEKGLFKEKAFGSKLKDDLIKNLMARQQAINASEEKPGTTLRACNPDGSLDSILGMVKTSDSKVEQVLKVCTEVLENVTKLHTRLDKHASECIAVDETLKLLQKIANRVTPGEEIEEVQVPRFMCSFCEVDSHKLADCKDKQRCLKCGLFSHKQDTCGFDKTCNYCGIKGHAARLHDVITQEERLKIFTFHGPEAFGHFMAADQQQGLVGEQQRGGYQGRRGRGRTLGYGRNSRGRKF